MARATADGSGSEVAPEKAERELLDLVATRLSVVLYRGRLSQDGLQLDFVSQDAERLIGSAAQQLCNRKDPFFEAIHPTDDGKWWISWGS